jgi:hypothetical protein
MRENLFSELGWDDWAKDACGHIANQAVCACLAVHQDEGCTAEQALRFRAAILLGVASNWIGPPP